MRWLIRTYTSETGRKPVEEWLDSLAPAAQAAVLEELRLLRAFGAALEMPHARPLDHGIWELRARGSDGIWRVLYFHWKGHTFGILHGFTKKTQSTPPHELAIARERMRTWLSR